MLDYNPFGKVYTDAKGGLVALKIAQGESEFPLVFTRGSFYRHNGIVWKKLVESYIKQIILSFDDTPLVKGHVLMNDSHIKGTFHAAQIHATRPSFFDNQPDGIAFSNGFLTVGPSGCLLEDIKPNVTWALNFPWTFDKDPVPLFTAYLNAIFKDEPDATLKVCLLQEFVGAALIGVASSFSKALVLIGDGGTGKSTFVHIIQNLFDRELQTSISPHRMADPYNIALLATSRLNAISEMPRADMIASETFKAVVTGDTLTGRFPYGKPFTCASTAAHLIAGNELPQVADSTDGFWDRVLVVRFLQKFRGTAGEIVNLKERIVREELRGVVQWALEGAIRLLQNCEYTAADSVVAEREEWRFESDQVKQFVLERTSSNGNWTSVGTLYQAYVAWANEAGHRFPLSKIAFGRRLKATVGAENFKVNGDGVRVYAVGLVRHIDSPPANIIQVN